MCKFVRKYPNLYTKKSDVNAGCRYPNNLIMPMHKLSITSAGPYAMTIKAYNKLPNYIKAEPDANIFINLLKKFLQDKCYYELNEFFNDTTNAML